LTNIHGPSPEVATVFYWGRYYIVVLVNGRQIHSRRIIAVFFYNAFIYKYTKAFRKGNLKWIP
jgi:hypothetical protein